METAVEKKSLGLNFTWNIRLNLIAEGDKLWMEGTKRREQGDMLWAEGAKYRTHKNGLKLWRQGTKLWVEGDRLRMEGVKLWEQGDKIWMEAIIEIYGNIEISWKNYSEEKKNFECYLENGEVFKP